MRDALDSALHGSQRYPPPHTLHTHTHLPPHSLQALCQPGGAQRRGAALPGAAAPRHVLRRRRCRGRRCQLRCARAVCLSGVGSFLLLLVLHQGWLCHSCHDGKLHSATRACTCRLSSVQLIVASPLTAQCVLVCCSDVAHQPGDGVGRDGSCQRRPRWAARCSLQFAALVWHTLPRHHLCVHLSGATQPDALGLPPRQPRSVDAACCQQAGHSYN